MADSAANPPKEAEANKEAAPAPKVQEEPKSLANKPTAPTDSELTQDDFVRARNCCIAVGVVVVAGIIAIGSSAFVKFPPPIFEYMRDGMFVPVQAGTTVFARLEGRRAETVLLIHGGFGASYSWRKVIPYLKNVHGLRVVSFDLLGFGLSDKPKDAVYTAQSMAGSTQCASNLTNAEQVRDLLLFLQVPPVHVVAHDIGTDVALLFAAQNANWVRSITLLNPARSGSLPKGSFLATVSDVVLSVLPHLRAKYTVWNAVQGSSISFGDIDQYAFLLAYKNGIETHEKALSAANLSKILTDENAEKLRQVPIQFVWGVNSIDKEELARAKKLLAPRKVVELPASHFVQEDQPERLAQAVATLISELPATPLPPEEAPRPPVYSDPMGAHGHSHGGHGHSHGGQSHSHGVVMEEEDNHAHSHSHGHGHDHSHGHGHAH